MSWLVTGRRCAGARGDSECVGHANKAVRFWLCFFFFQAEDGIRDIGVTGVQTCALPI